MARGYTHLSYEERVVIRALRKLGKGIREVSRELGRAPSTVSRELFRNEQFVGTRVIYPIHAQYKANGRRRRAYWKPRLKSKRNQRYIERKLQAGWSPETIAGRMRRCGQVDAVSHEAIYQWIYRQRLDLRDCLVRHHKRRKKRGQSKRHSKPHIAQATPLCQRPQAANDRQEFGHWEADSMVSKANTTAVHVVLERVSRKVCLSRIEANKASKVKSALVRRLSRFPPQLRASITYDNGHENAHHRVVNQALRTSSYFCAPYRSWEKGSVENIIGRIRRTFPKGTDLNKVSLQALKRLERNLNATPRKCLHFQTPMEVFAHHRVALQC